MESLFPAENISFFVCHKIFSFLLIVEKSSDSALIYASCFKIAYAKNEKNLQICL